MVKLLSSEYLLGEKSRAAGHWVKMKPEYGGQADCSAHSHTYIHSYIHTCINEKTRPRIWIWPFWAATTESPAAREVRVSRNSCAEVAFDCMFVCMYV